MRKFIPKQILNEAYLLQDMVLPTFVVEVCHVRLEYQIISTKPIIILLKSLTQQITLMRNKPQSIDLDVIWLDNENFPLFLSIEVMFHWRKIACIFLSENI